MSPSKKRVSRNFLRSATPLEKTSSAPLQYLVEREERTFLLERHGTCEYERCKAICCRMLCLNLQWNEYLAGFAEMGIRAPLIYRTCRYLALDWTYAPSSLSPSSRSACHCSMVFAFETQQVDIASPFVGGDLTLCDPLQRSKCH